MSDINGAARNRLNNLSNVKSRQFDTEMLHNLVSVDIALDNDTQLYTTIEVLEWLYHLNEVAEVDSLESAAWTATEQLNSEVDKLARIEVASTCAEIIRNGEDWADHWDEDQISDAQSEAQMWLRANPVPAVQADAYDLIDIGDESEGDEE